MTNKSIYKKLKKSLNLKLGLFFLLVFALFTILVKSKALNSLDYTVIVKLQNHIPRQWDMALSFFSLAGSFEITIVILLLLLYRTKKLKGSIIALSLFLFAHVVEFIGKAFLNHPGPPFMFFRYNIPFLFPSSYVQPGSSYPSGHSLRIVFIAIVTFYFIHFSKKLMPKQKLIYNALVLMIVISMLITRVSLGEHWLTDVIGGSLLGVSFGLIALIFL